MTTKHTPGPWQATRGWTASQDSNGNLYGIWGRNNDGHMSHIANTYDSPYTTPREQHANALLLAAAPEMLAALNTLSLADPLAVRKALLVAGIGIRAVDSFDAALMSLPGIIAKAKGEPKP